MKLNEKQKEFVMTMFEYMNSEAFQLDIYQKYTLTQVVRDISDGSIFEVTEVGRTRLNEVRDKYIKNILKK